MRRYATEHIAELVDGLERDRQIAAERVNATAEAFLDATRERAQAEQNLVAAVALTRQNAPRDFNRSRADDAVAAVSKLLQQGGEVFKRIPAKHRLGLLWLDWSGARVSTVDNVWVGDYDEPRQRVRLRASTTKARRALWVELHPVLAEAIEGTLPHRRFRDPDASLLRESGADALRTAIGKGCRAAGVPLFSPHDPASPSHLAAAPARRAVGADRRVRRPARLDGDCEHLHARPRRRGRGRLHGAARVTDVSVVRGRCGPGGAKTRVCRVGLDPTRGVSPLLGMRKAHGYAGEVCEEGPEMRPRAVPVLSQDLATADNAQPETLVLVVEDLMEPLAPCPEHSPDEAGTVACCLPWRDPAVGADRPQSHAPGQGLNIGSVTPMFRP